MQRQNNILVITDTRSHKDRDAFYPMLNHLVDQDNVNKVFVADRAHKENYEFFEAHNPDIQALLVCEPDQNYSFDNANNQDQYPLKTIGFDDFDTLWIRLDHPITDEFLRYLRDTVQYKHGKFVSNDPEGVIITGSKQLLADIKDDMGDLMPDVQLCNTAEEVQEFHNVHPNGIVLKQLRSYGGKGVVRYNPQDPQNSDLNTYEDIKQFLEDAGPCLGMEFLQPEQQSDNRIMVVNGEIIGAIQRTPGKDGWQCNLTAGGNYAGVEITNREEQIVQKLTPYMKQHGIFLYGVDALLNDNGERVLSEVNTSNVGLIYVLEKVTGTPYTKMVAESFAEIVEQRRLDTDKKFIA